MTEIHLPHPGTTEESHCGMAYGPLSDDLDEVTCKWCRLNYWRRHQGGR